MELKVSGAESSELQKDLDRWINEGGTPKEAN